MTCPATHSILQNTEYKGIAGKKIGTFPDRTRGQKWGQCWCRSTIKGGGRFWAGQCFWAGIFLIDLHKSFCKWAQIGPSFRDWNMRTKILLLPFLLTPQKCLQLDLFIKNTRMGIFKKVFFHGEGIMMCIRLPHTLLHPFFMEKELKSKCSKIFTEPKTPKGGYTRLITMRSKPDYVEAGLS